jgi:wyosine [tRNA(Phe)-imidazoG37] synthetase (radical SAM superfamily)
MHVLRLRQFQDHSRDWRQNFYVYPVISRRSGGLSIGINLNPDAACNFDCVYCQVDRTVPPKVRDVDVTRLGEELIAMIGAAQSGQLFEDPQFADVPPALRIIRDIAFSGDGEPTTCKEFEASVALVARVKQHAGLNTVKMVLITDACYLTRPQVQAGLRIMDENQGEIWAKLDAGTEGYYRTVNRPNYPLSHVIENITTAARVRPLVIQSLFMRLNGIGPDEAELLAYTDRLNEILAGGGAIKYVQVYTVARRPAESYVSALSNTEVDGIAELVRRRCGLAAEAYYGG